MEAIDSKKESFQEVKKNYIVPLVVSPIVQILFAAWALVSGKARDVGMAAAVWTALGCASLSLLLFIYNQVTLPDKNGYNPPRGNLLVRFLSHSIEVAVICYISVPILSVLIDRLLGLARMIPIPYNWLGLIILIPSVMLGTWTMVLFFTRGKGMPIPIEATRNLIIEGPFRYVRNPMDISALLIGVGLSIILGSYTLLVLTIYSIFHAHKQTVKVEEFEMETRFKQAYLDYKARVPRWIPRLRPND